MNLEIIPAILEKRFNQIQEKIAKLAKLTPLIIWVQLDIGDGKFTPKTFWSPRKFKKIKSKFFWEAHLMVKNPRAYIDGLKEIGFKRIVFHIEPFFQARKKTREFDVNNLLKGLQGKLEVGIAINPETSPVHIVPYLERIDEVLLLSVSPGKQGQRFDPQVLAKIGFFKNLKPELKIGVDGGINETNIKEVFSAGADRAYIGSCLWQSRNLKETIHKLKEAH